MSAAVAIALLAVGLLAFVAALVAGAMAHALPAGEETEAWRSTKERR